VFCKLAQKKFNFIVFSMFTTHKTISVYNVYVVSCIMGEIVQCLALGILNVVIC